MPQHLIQNSDTPPSSSKSSRTKARLFSMEKSPRRPRGANADNVQVGYWISHEAKQVLIEVSDKLGVSASQGLDLILTHLERDADGLPLWADQVPLSKDSHVAKAS